MLQRLAIRTTAQECLVDIAGEVRDAVEATGIAEGTALLYMPSRPAASPSRRTPTPASSTICCFTDPVVYRFMLDDEPITTAEQAAAIVRFYVDTPGATYNRWVLVRKADGEPLGTCGYHRWSQQHRKAEIGYDLSPAWHGQGYMREAMGAALRHGFEAMQLHRIEALVAVANERSAHLLRRLGFAREGLLRECFFSGGRFHDHELYALIRQA